MGRVVEYPVSRDPGLAAVAEQVPASEGEAVLVCNDARMGEVYWAAFRSDGSGGVTALTAESVSPPDRVPFDVAALRHAAGNGIARHPALRQRLESAALQVHDGLSPRADAIERLGR